VLVSVVRMRRLVLAALLCLAVAPAVAAAQADEGASRGDRVVITGPVTIGGGQTADDVVVIDGPVTVDGRVRGDLVVVNGTVRISGTVDGDVVTIAKRLILEPGARVGGDVVYGDERPVVPRGATVGGEVRRVDFDEVADPLGFVGWIAVWLAVTVSTLILGLLMLWLAPRALEAAWESGRTALGPAIGWGLALFFGIPIVAVIALITLVGIPLGIGLLLALLPLYALGYTTAAWLLGRRIVASRRRRVVAFLAGLGILRLLALIPILGGIVWFAATVLGLGALVVAVWRARSDRPRQAAAPAG
jgi:hypothetical protein